MVNMVNTILIKQSVRIIYPAIGRCIVQMWAVRVIIFRPRCLLTDHDIQMLLALRTGEPELLSNELCHLPCSVKINALSSERHLHLLYFLLPVEYGYTDQFTGQIHRKPEIVICNCKVHTCSLLLFRPEAEIVRLLRRLCILVA